MEKKLDHKDENVWQWTENDQLVIFISSILLGVGMVAHCLWWSLAVVSNDRRKGAG